MNGINSLSEDSIKESLMNTGQLGNSGDGVIVIWSLTGEQDRLGGDSGEEI